MEGGQLKKRLEFEEGSSFLLHTIQGTSNCLDCLITRNSDKLVSLVDMGREQSIINVYSLVSDFELIRSFDVEDRCGYLALSPCETLLAG